MGQVKSALYEAQEQAVLSVSAFAEVIAEVIAKHIPKQEVHILMCDGGVLGVYADKRTAYHDMELCRRANTNDGTNLSYSVITKTVNWDEV